MAAPVIYHGGAGGVSPWPNIAAAPYVPSVSVLARSIWLPATNWQPGLVENNTCPPIFYNCNEFIPGAPGDWFDRTLAFPLAAFSGSWAQTSFWLPENADLTWSALGLLRFRIIMFGGIGNVNAVDWHLRLTVENPGVVVAVGGPGTLVQIVPAANQIMYSVLTDVEAKRGGVSVPLVAGRMYHLNIFRNDNTSIDLAHLMGVVVNYAVVA